MNPKSEASISKKLDKNDTIRKTSALIDIGNQTQDLEEENLSFVPVLGMPLVEYQIRLLVEAGIDHIVLWAENIFSDSSHCDSSSLDKKAHFNFRFINMIDKFRQEGIHLKIAHSRLELNSIFSDENFIFLLDNGCLPSLDLIKLVIDNPLPAILTIKDGKSSRAFERIDASDRWGGVVLVDGKALKAALTIPEDWDLFLTIMRQITQSSCSRISVKTLPEVSLNRKIFVIKATKDQDNSVISNTLFQLSNKFYKNEIFGKISNNVLHILTKNRKNSLFLFISSFALTFFSILLSLIKMPMLSLLLLIFSSFSEYGCNQLNALQLNPKRKKQKRLIFYSRRISAIMILFASSYFLNPYTGWGIFPLEFILIFSNFVANQESASLRKLLPDHKNHMHLYFEYILWSFLPLTFLLRYNVLFYLYGLTILSILSVLNYGLSSYRLQKILASRAP